MIHTVSYPHLRLSLIQEMTKQRKIKAMAIEIVWDNDNQTIIRVTFPEQWTWDDFLEVDTITAKMVDSVNHKVCFLADLRQTKRIPTGLKLDIANQVLDFRHENSDLLIIVGMNKMIRALLNITLMALSRIRTQIKIVETIDEAYECIHHRLLEIARYGG